MTRSKYSKVLSAAAVVMAALMALSACGGTAEDDGDGEETIKIGFINDFTGWSAVYGGEQRSAVELAVEKINAGDGPKIELVTEDGLSTDTGEVTAAQKLIADPEIQGFIGIGATPLGAVVIPLFGQDGRPMLLQQCTAIPDRPSNVFSMSPDVKELSTMFAEYVYSTLEEGDTVAFITQAGHPTLTSARDAWKATAEAQGVTVVSDQEAPTTATSFGPQITNVLSSQPDAIGVSFLGATAGPVISSLRSQGFEGLIFGNPPVIQPVVGQAAGEAAEGVLGANFWDPSVATTSEISKEYLDAWNAKYPDQTTSYLGMEAYDSVFIMYETLLKHGSDPEAAVDYLASTKFDTGLQEQVGFLDTGFIDLNGYVFELGYNGDNKLVQ